MIDPVFIINAKIALSIKKTRVTAGNRVYGFLVESIIRGHKDYKSLVSLRKDKKADRKKTASLTKKMLKQRLDEMGKTLEDFNDDFEDTKICNEPYMMLLRAEKYAFKLLKPYLEAEPLWAWMKSVRGLGLNFGVKLLCYLKDVKRFPNPSKLRKYCGTTPMSKRRRGVEAHFNPELKGILLGQIAKSFLMGNSQYRVVYDCKKKHYQTKYAKELLECEVKKKQKKKITKEDWTKLKIHNYSMKAMVNRFLVELWLAAHLVEGNEPPTNPYIVNDPKHSMAPMIVPVTEDMIVQKEQKPRRT